MSAAHGSFAFSQTPKLNPSPLQDLEEAHDRLSAEMTKMEALTSRPEIDWPTFCTARWRVSGASLARRTLASRIIKTLQSRARVDEYSELKLLNGLDQRMLRISAQHVRDWPLHSIQGNWSGYCDASRDVRLEMANFLASERRILFPILGANLPTPIVRPNGQNLGETRAFDQPR
jgi:hypothetical protein